MEKSETATAENDEIGEKTAQDEIARAGEVSETFTPTVSVVAPIAPAAPERMLSSAGFYVVALIVIGLDQAVKAWVRAAIPLDGSWAIWPGVFQLTHTQNKGMAFSLLPGQTILLAIAAIVVALFIVFAQRRIGDKMPLLLGLSLALPLGGAIGNLIDRLRHGYVTDLFDFRIIHFPVFNVADAAISIGIALLMWRTLTTKEATLLSKERSDAPTPAPQAQEIP